MLPRARMSWSALLVLGALAGVPLSSETDPARVLRTAEVTVERVRNNQWNAIDPRTVFQAGDEVRFRFQSNFAGFLYVLDRTASGEQIWMFPTAEAGVDNEVQANREYLIPTTDGTFQIPKEAGYDTVFWIVNSTPLAGFAGLPVQPPPLRSLLPRCREITNCFDKTAGARPVTKSEMPVTGAGPLVARDLSLNRSASSMKTKASAKEPGPVVFEIRLAHQ